MILFQKKTWLYLFSADSKSPNITGCPGPISLLANTNRTKDGGEYYEWDSVYTISYQDETEVKKKLVRSRRFLTALKTMVYSRV